MRFRRSVSSEWAGDEGAGSPLLTLFLLYLQGERACELALSQTPGAKESSVISEKLSAATSSNSSVLGDGWRRDRQEFRAALGYNRPFLGEEGGGEGGFQWYQHTPVAFSIWLSTKHLYLTKQTPHNPQPA